VETAGGVELDTVEFGVEAEIHAEFNAVDEIEELEVFPDSVEFITGAGRGAIKICFSSSQNSSLCLISGIQDESDSYLNEFNS